MRAVIQRVTEASVSVKESGQMRDVAAIDRGILAFVGVGAEDAEEDAAYIAGKIAGIRIFEDADGKLNLGLSEVGGSVLLISNFTLYADCRKGRRPGFSGAASGEVAERLYRRVGTLLENVGIPVRYGEFGAEMRIANVNDGPVTILLDSGHTF